MIPRLRKVYGAYRATLFWIVAGFFALGGILSAMFGEYNRALAGLGSAAVIILALLLLRLKR
jgi:uncharacterized oligopeptide transporter (OPT) family protein